MANLEKKLKSLEKKFRKIKSKRKKVEYQIGEQEYAAEGVVRVKYDKKLSELVILDHRNKRYKGKQKDKIFQGKKIGKRILLSGAYTTVLELCEKMGADAYKLKPYERWESRGGCGMFCPAHCNCKETSLAFYGTEITLYKRKKKKK